VRILKVLGLPEKFNTTYSFG